MRLRPIRPVLPTVLVTLLATLVVAGTPSLTSSTGAGTARPERGLRMAAATGCPEVVVVGVDGGGRGWSARLKHAGEPLREVVSATRQRVTGDGGTAAVRHLGVDFRSVTALVRGARTRPTTKAVTPRRARAWRAGVGPATRELTAGLHRMAAACPEQGYVLAGHAQGASAVHRALLAAADDDALTGRIVGAALVSDPDRAPRTRATLTGAPTAKASGRGVVWKLLDQPGDVPAAGQEARVVSVCTAGDLVCDLRRGKVRNALEAHRSYDTARGRAALQSAARLLAERASAWPRLQADQVVEVQPDTPFTRRIAVRVGTRYTATFSATGLPSGVTLSPDGVLSGTVQDSGIWDLDVTVRGTSPRTTPDTGKVTLKAVDAEVVNRLSAGGQSTCHVRAGGTAVCVGANSSGQLGDGTATDRATSGRVGQPGEWRRIVTGGSTSCGIKNSGALYCWGQNNRGQLGLGGGTQKWTPQRVGRSSDWADVSASWLHTCAVRGDSSLWCWGENGQGQLGLGHRRSREAPTKVGTGWRSVTTGGWHTCAVRTDGTAWCWGLDDLGQLGTGTGPRQLRPTAVAPQQRWQSLDATWSSTCGLTRSGQVQCWGLNDQGQLGDGSRRGRSVPTPLSLDRGWSAVTLGDAYGCALDTRGAAWCWGNNDYGQLGDGSTTPRTNPVRVAGGRTWAAIDAGWMHTCATTLEEALQCWGNNENGQLARGDRVDRSTPPGVSVVTMRRGRQAPQDDVVVTTFNVLGSQHTRPGGGAGNYAPGRIRTEWSKNLLDVLKSDIVAFQELQVDQYGNLKRALGDTHAFYPATTRRTKRVWQSVMWDRSQWSLVEARTVSIPKLGRTRPMPLVRLDNRATGRDIWVFNVHNSSGNQPGRQRERNRAVRIEISNILAERRQRVPLVFLGDMNERRTVFCKVTTKTDLESVTGGSNRRGRCRPPRAMRLDWIFASPELPVQNARFVRDARVARITDHAVLTSRLGLP